MWNRVLWYISKRERCEKEVRNYIAKISNFKFQISNSEKEEIVTKLKSLDFLNVDRFTRAYVHDSVNLKRKGKFRIRQELKNKQINEETIDKYLNEIKKEDELETVMTLAKRKHELIKHLSTDSQKRRLFGFLVRRGFSPQNAASAIDKLVRKK